MKIITPIDTPMYRLYTLLRQSIVLMDASEFRRFNTKYRTDGLESLISGPDQGLDIISHMYESKNVDHIVGLWTDMCTVHLSLSNVRELILINGIASHSWCLDRSSTVCITLLDSWIRSKDRFGDVADCTTTRHQLISAVALCSASNDSLLKASMSSKTSVSRVELTSMVLARIKAQPTRVSDILSVLLNGLDDPSLFKISIAYPTQTRPKYQHTKRKVLIKQILDWASDGLRAITHTLPETQGAAHD